jgi:hypothetical protein
MPHSNVFGQLFRLVPASSARCAFVEVAPDIPAVAKPENVAA